MKVARVKIFFVKDIIRKVRNDRACRQAFYPVLKVDVFLQVKARQAAKNRSARDDQIGAASLAKIVKLIYALKAFCVNFWMPQRRSGFSGLYVAGKNIVAIFVKGASGVTSWRRRLFVRSCKKTESALIGVLWKNSKNVRIIL